MDVINLSNYTSPIIDENNRSKPYVTFDIKGDRTPNAYFQYLFDRKNGSATNGAIINSVCSILYGKGLNSESFDELLSEEHQRRLINDFKVTGMGAVEVIYQGGRKKIGKANHIPIEMLAPEKMDNNGVINAYYFARDWSKVRSASDTERIVSFYSKERKGKEIIYLKPYSQGNIYFSAPDYQGGLQYAELEEEISNYHITNVQNSFSPSMMINLNNGVPEDEEKQRQIIKRMERKFTGSGGAKLVVMMNDNKEQATTIEPIALSDAPEQYNFVSEEASRKLITAHRVTSPLLLGISTSTGFGSNSDELKTASVLFESLVIQPMRQQVISVYNKINEFNGVTEELAYESLNPFQDLTETEEEVVNDTTEEEKTYDTEATTLSKCACKLSNDDFLTEEIASKLIDLGDEIDLSLYDVIDESEVDYDNEDLNFSNKEQSYLSKLITKLVRTGTARPNARSEQDNDDVVVRYRYAGNKSPQRPFCRAMMSADKRYRKEDIIQMGNQVVNAGWGANGSDTYSIWLYAGGGNCYHKWNRVIYLKKGSSVDVNSPLAKVITRSEARRRGIPITVNNAPEEQGRASQGVAPINQVNQGFLNPR